MATWANLQSALTNAGSDIGPARKIQAAAKTRVQTAFAAAYPDAFADAAAVTADDVSAWLGRQLESFVRKDEQRALEQALTPPTTLDDT